MIDIYGHVSLVAHRIQSLHRQIDDLVREDYPSRTPTVLGELLERLLNQLFGDLVKLKPEVNKRSADDILRNLQTINHMVLWLGQMIEAIQGARISSPMSSFIEALENLSGRIAFGTRLIVYPQWDYNASLVEVMSSIRQSLPTRVIRAEGQDIFQGVPTYLVLITFPAMEERNILNHAALTHELGHFIDEVNSISFNIINNLKLDITYQTYIEQIKVDAKQASNTPIITLATKMVENWITELVADLLGVCVMGPAQLMAFDGVARVFSVTNPPSSVSVTHPPFHLRAKYMANIITRRYFEPLQREGYVDSLEVDERDTLELITKWVNAVTKVNLQQNRVVAPRITEHQERLIYQLCNYSLEKAYELISVEIDKLSKLGWFCKPVDIVDAVKLNKLLLHGLTPSELLWDRKRFPSFAAIMNSGWFYLIQHSSIYDYFGETAGRQPEPSGVFTRYLNLQDLIAKAIEASLFRSEYTRRRGIRNAPESDGNINAN